MFVHGYMLFPDYVAIALLICNAAFLLALTAFAIKDVLISSIHNFNFNLFKLPSIDISSHSVNANYNPHNPRIF